MILFGNAHDLGLRLKSDSRFHLAFRYLELCFQTGSEENLRLTQMAEGKAKRIDIQGDLYAMEQVYTTRQRPDCFFESHRRHIDVQCFLSGEEGIEVLPITQLKIDKPFDEARDLITYHDRKDATRLTLKAGEAAVFFPSDGHMPGLQIAGPCLVRKTVVKVPV